MIERLEQFAQRPVSRETYEKLRSYVALLKHENEHQNLVSAATLDQVWDRHILDSVQLVRFEPRAGASWVDIGSGAGLPGIVVACVVDGPVTLVEPRRLRVEFLHKACESLGIGAQIICSKVERLEGRYDVITARALARLAETIRISQHLSTIKTVWALPKGRTAREELAEAEKSWQGEFHVERSLTDAESGIIVGRGVRSK